MVRNSSDASRTESGSESVEIIVTFPLPKEVEGESIDPGAADATASTPTSIDKTKVDNELTNSENQESSGIYDYTIDFQIPEDPKVDILLVVDSSTSMAPAQDSLADNFEMFITEINNSSLDFQIAITSMDICDSNFPSADTNNPCPVDSSLSEFGLEADHLRGDFVGEVGKEILKRGDSDLLDTFKTAVKVGNTGSDFEHGLKAIELAVGKDQDGTNPSLIREDSFLSIIVVSDDDGIGLGIPDPYKGDAIFNQLMGGTFEYTFSELDSYLYLVKPKKNYSISAITVLQAGDYGTEDAECQTTMDYVLQTGDVYLDAANQTGGVIKDICDTNWGDNLQSIGIDLHRQVMQIPLNAVPIIDSEIKVFVDSILFDHWTFVEQTNSIKFDSDNIPAAFSDVRIEFQSLEIPLP
ncbi:MAG: hypothetical protein AB8G05_24485 [Oligoflexales bacterium]